MEAILRNVDLLSSQTLREALTMPLGSHDDQPDALYRNLDRGIENTNAQVEDTMRRVDQIMEDAQRRMEEANNMIAEASRRMRQTNQTIRATVRMTTPAMGVESINVNISVPADPKAYVEPEVTIDISEEFAAHQDRKTVEERMARMSDLVDD